MSKEETNLDPEVVRALEAILLVAMEPVAPFSTCQSRRWISFSVAP